MYDRLLESKPVRRNVEKIQAKSPVLMNATPGRPFSIKRTLGRLFKRR